MNGLRKTKLNTTAKHKLLALDGHGRMDGPDLWLLA